MQISVDVLVRQIRSARELNTDLVGSHRDCFIGPLVTLCLEAVAHIQGIVLAAIGRRLA